MNAALGSKAIFWCPPSEVQPALTSCDGTLRELVSLLLKAHEIVLLLFFIPTVKTAARYNAWFMGLMGFIVLCLRPVGTSR
jgi:hypothetical protein